MYNNVIRYLLLVFGVSLSAVAAYCSVYGISHLFVGGGTIIIVLASILEASKIISLSFIYRFWNRLKTIMRVYFVSAIIAVSLITNLGIYGYLTNAYAKSLSVFESRTQTESIYQDKISFLENNIQALTREAESNNSQIAIVREAIANPTTIQYVDSETGQLVTTTSARQRRDLEAQLNELSTTKLLIDSQRNQLQDSIYTIHEYLNTSDTLSIASELGSLSFISDVTGYEMNRIVNIFVIIIMMIFDPLAIMMILGFNITTKKIEKNNIDNFESSEKETIFETEEDIKAEEENIPEPISTENISQKSQSKIVSTYV